MSIQAGWNSVLYQAGMLTKLGKVEKRLPEPKKPYEKPTIEISDELKPEQISRIQGATRREASANVRPGPGAWTASQEALANRETSDPRGAVGAVDAEGNPIAGNTETTFGQELRRRMVDFEDQARAQGVPEDQIRTLSDRMTQGLGFTRSQGQMQGGNQ